VFLWSLVPLFAAQAEFLITGQSLIGRLLFGRIGGYYSAAFQLTPEGFSDNRAQLGDAGFNLLLFARPLAFVTNPELWVGFLVAAAFITGAVYLRRYRDDS